MLPFYLSLVETDYDKDKLEYIYRKYYSLMLAVAIDKLKSKEAAEDVVHDAVLRIINHLDKVDIHNDYKTKSFVCTVVTHLAIDVLRHNASFQAENIDDVEYMLYSKEPLPIDHIISEDGYKTLVSYISSLGDKYKTVCQLKYINGLKESQIADLLELPPKTVNVRIFRARQKLIKMIKEGLNVNQANER